MLKGLVSAEEFQTQMMFGYGGLAADWTLAEKKNNLTWAGFHKLSFQA